MRSYRRPGSIAVLIGVALVTLVALYSEHSCNGLLPFSGWVEDEAKCADVSPEELRAAGIEEVDVAERYYFSKMDRGIDLTNQESAGRIMWMVWTAGNDRFWDETTKNIDGIFDWLKTISSNPEYGFCTKHKYKSGKYGKYEEDQYKPYYRSSSENEGDWALDKKQCEANKDLTWVPISRDNRWKYFGLINEPCFGKATKPDKYGLWLDERMPKSDKCPPDPFENIKKYPGIQIGARGKGEGENYLPVGSYYGKASGVVGMRLFPNPDFDNEAQKQWMDNKDKFYTDPTYYSNKDLIRPYRVGVSCALCHVGPSPVNPPKDPEKPEWENLSSTVGAQYLWLDRAFLWNPQDHKNFYYQLLRTTRPGTFDTSLVSSDNINNSRTQNAVYGFCSRLVAGLRWGKEILAGGALSNRQFNDLEGNNYPATICNGVPTRNLFKHPNTVWTPRILRDASDTAGVLGSLNRIYLNIGSFSEEWLLHFRSFVGALPFSPITPIKVADAQKNSSYWQATEAQTPFMAYFLAKAGRPDYLKEAVTESLKRFAGIRNTPATAAAQKSLDTKAASKRGAHEGVDAPPLVDEPEPYSSPEQEAEVRPNAEKEALEKLKQELEGNSEKLEPGKMIFANRCARCHSSQIPKTVENCRQIPKWTNPLDELGCKDDYMTCWKKYWEWTNCDDFKKQMRKIVARPDFLEKDYLSNDVRVPMTVLETNACASLATNAIAGNIWDNFSSQTYKDLPSVGSLEFSPPWDHDNKVFNPFLVNDRITNPYLTQNSTAIETQSYEMPDGGRGYIRPPSLISLWSTAPFLLNNTLGKFNPDPSINARMDSFEDSIEKLLWPEKRKWDPIFQRRNNPKLPRQNRGVGLIERTTMPSRLKIDLPAVRPWRNLLSLLLPSIFDSGSIIIGPIPTGTPVNMFANLPLSLRSLIVLVRGIAPLARLPSDPTESQATNALNPLVKPLLALNTCPDFVVNKGHYFGADLPDQKKSDLIRFLKTF